MGNITQETEEVDEDHPGAEAVQVLPVPLKEDGGGDEVEEGQDQEYSYLHVFKEQLRAFGGQRVQI